MLTCREAAARMSEYVERELSFLGPAQLRAHLVVCDMCRVYLDQLLKTRALLGAVGRDVADEAAVDAVLAALGSRRAGAGE